jgi:hypothetical protein
VTTGPAVSVVLLVVKKLLEKNVCASPFTPWIPVVVCRKYWLLAANGALGTKRMIVPVWSSVIVPATTPPLPKFCRNSTVLAFTEFGFSASLYFSSTTAFSGTPVALCTGLLATGCGATAVVSTAVRNDPW